MIVRDCVGTLATEPAAAVMADLTAAVLCIGDLGVMHFRRGQHQPAPASRRLPTNITHVAICIVYNS